MLLDKPLMAHGLAKAEEEKQNSISIILV